MLILKCLGVNCRHFHHTARLALQEVVGKARAVGAWLHIRLSRTANENFARGRFLFEGVLAVKANSLVFRVGRDCFLLMKKALECEFHLCFLSRDFFYYILTDREEDCQEKKAKEREKPLK